MVLSLGVASVAKSRRRQSPGKSPEIRFAPEPASIFLQPQNGGVNKSVSLQELVESRCQSLSSKFRPSWWLFNGHLQTLYSVLGDFSKTDQMWYDRRLLRLLDGGTLGLDFAPLDASTVRDDAPIIVVQHGLTGGSHEPYIRAVLAPACSPVEQGGLGYRAVVVNFRGCSGVPITSPKFYTAAQTDDLRQALMYISKLYPHAPLLGLGFSIGGNVLTRYLAEEGADSLLRSACILGCPWDLKANNDYLLYNNTLGKRLYLRGMGENVITIMKQHRQVFLADPRTAKAAHTVLHMKRPTLTDIDHLFTASVGTTAPFPFEDVHKYYIWASSHKVAEQIRVPCLTINAAGTALFRLLFFHAPGLIVPVDDPVVQRVQTSVGQNGYIVSVLTATGGHLGWFESKRKRWTTKPLLEWMQLFGTDVVRNPIELSLSIDEDGYIRDSRWPNLGCKEVAGGGRIDGNRPKSQLFQGL
ncbi:AB hydrolase-1 domain-containing protein [Mycena sanguinolenta]|uniref:AB hydrolase-1 domain-containing protein n=1 Tax=Mycena sanguinolenta TaxID=230812 RepID=A0A8H7DJQ0_9AGAR|nr:AB hydrolase-1 domain-containing protein [Mycena sanguinolenta]